MSEDLRGFLKGNVICRELTVYSLDGLFAELSVDGNLDFAGIRKHEPWSTIENMSSIETKTPRANDDDPEGIL